MLSKQANSLSALFESGMLQVSTSIGSGPVGKYTVEFLVWNNLLWNIPHMEYDFGFPNLQVQQKPGPPVE